MTIICNGCKNQFTVGSTNTDSFMVDVCYKCHPFFTGTQKIVDIANKAKDFEKRQQAAKVLQQKIAAQKAEKAKKVEASNASNSSNAPMTLKDMMKLLKQGDKQ